MDKRKQLSRLFGFLIGFTIFLVLAVVVFTVKITVYDEYSNAQWGIRIKYPDYWDVVENKDGTIAMFITPKETGLDTFLENVNITHIDLSKKPLTLSQFSQETMVQVEGTFKGAIRVLRSRPMSLAGRRGHLYSYQAIGSQPNNTIKYMHAWMVDGYDAYIITYVGRGRGFDQHLSEVKSMMRSFRFDKINKKQ